jgi:hypothetical protein
MISRFRSSGKSMRGILVATLGVLTLGSGVAAGSALPTGWPEWHQPQAAVDDGVSDVRLQVLPVAHGQRGFEIRAGGHSAGFANLVSTIAYRHDGNVRLTEISGTSWVDPDGGRWKFETKFRPKKDMVEVEVAISVDQDRETLFVPVLTVFAGGDEKGQGLFAGVEYLDNEPSSSELDLAGPQSQRQIPPVHDFTFPLMAIQSNGRYIGLAWDNGRDFGALFDSPDRTFHSGGHVMGVIWPAEEDGGREPGQLLPKSPTLLKANHPLRLRAWILAGRGDSVVSAVQQYIRLRGLPGLPKTGVNYQDYITTTEAGWLKSKIHVGDLYRHALAEGNFAPAPATDAAVFETWLASREKDPTLQDSLLTNAAAALARADLSSLNRSGPGHIQSPVAALVFGHLQEAVAAARTDAVNALARFDSEGRVIYHPAPGGMDFGRGHFAPDANGYTASAVVTALENSAFCGDRGLIERSVAMLRRQDHFHGSVPRGVQVWELPLHVPDIMASAYLTRAYVDGYEITGDPHLLDEAIHWAWAGMPFVYLRNPVEKPIGSYATIAVYGATHWRAPNWIGLPVQWCGLVYSDALYRLAEHETWPWRQVADGIALSGVQQVFPLSEPDHAGLLPDSFVLASQHRNPPDINPATLGMSAVRLYTGNCIDDFRGIPNNGVLIHAPGRITLGKCDEHRAVLVIDAWPNQPCFALINRLPAASKVVVNGHRIELTSPNSFDAARGQLMLQIKGKTSVRLTF